MGHLSLPSLSDHCHFYSIFTVVTIVYHLLYHSVCFCNWKEFESMLILFFFSSMRSQIRDRKENAFSWAAALAVVTLEIFVGGELDCPPALCRLLIFHAHRGSDLYFHLCHLSTYSISLFHLKKPLWQLPDC
jgi:hypothetical protein